MARAVRQGLLRHFKLQNAVVVGRLHVVGVYTAQVKLTAVRAKGALAADVVVLVVLFFLLCLALGVNGQRVAVDIEMDVLLVKARQVGLQRVAVAVILDVGLELCERAVVEPAAERIVKEITLKRVHFTERVVSTQVVSSIIIVTIRSHVKHKSFSSLL